MNHKTNADAQPDVDGAFLKTLQTHQKGNCLSEASESLRKVTEAVSECAKAGYTNIRLHVIPAATGDGSAFGFEVEVTEKLPRKKAYRGLFFKDDQNNLVRDNPNQEALPALRTLNGGAAEEETIPLKKVNS